MENTFTTNFLIKVLYNENFACNNELAKAKAFIDGDIVLSDMFNDLKLAKDTIPKVKFRPSNKTISTILNHSRSKPSFEAAV